MIEIGDPCLFPHQPESDGCNKVYCHHTEDQWRMLLRRRHMFPSAIERIHKEIDPGIVIKLSAFRRSRAKKL